MIFKKIQKKFAEKIDKSYPNWDASIALRYLPIVLEIQKSGAKNKKILEVGSGEFGITPYLSNQITVTGVDIDFGEKKAKNLIPVISSAEKLPFENNSFDIVICLDTLEHLPVQIRKKAIFEMVRVAKKEILLAFPRGKLSALIDRFLANFYRITHGQKLAFLAEHQKFVLPETKNVIQYICLAMSKYDMVAMIKKFGNTNLCLWLFLLILGFSEKQFLTSWYRRLLLALPILRYFNFWPNYREMIFVNFKINQWQRFQL